MEYHNNIQMLIMLSSESTTPLFHCYLGASTATSAQSIGVVSVFVTRGDHQHAKTDDVGRPAPNPLRRAWVPETLCQPIRQAHPALGLPQRQQRLILLKKHSIWLHARYSTGLTQR